MNDQNEQKEYQRQLQYRVKQAREQAGRSGRAKKASAGLPPMMTQGSENAEEPPEEEMMNEEGVEPEYSREEPERAQDQSEIERARRISLETKKQFSREQSSAAKTAEGIGKGAAQTEKSVAEGTKAVATTAKSAVTAGRVVIAIIGFIASTWYIWLALAIIILIVVLISNIDLKCVVLNEKLPDNFMGILKNVFNVCEEMTNSSPK